MIGPIAGTTQSAAAQDDGDGDGGPGGTFGSGFVGIIDTGQIGNEALIEEPVASGGESTLWTDGEGEDEDEDEDENAAQDDQVPVEQGNEP